jgi:hypothetical protein
MRNFNPNMIIANKVIIDEAKRYKPNLVEMESFEM